MKIKPLSKIVILSLLFYALNSQAQIADIFRLETTYLPSSSNNSSYERYRALFNVPVKVKESDYLFFGLDYSKINVLHGDNVTIETSEFDKFQIIDFNIGYTHKINEFWRYVLSLKPGVSSNLEDNLRNGDFTLSGSALFINDHTKDPNAKKPYRFIFGASFSGNGGFRFPLPIINYYRELTDKWSYTLGVPKTRVKYIFSPKFSMEAYVGLDGFNSNIQDASGVMFDNNRVPQFIRLQMFVGGLGYDYKLTKHIVLYAKTSYILGSSLLLRDDDRNDVFDFDIDNNIYLRGGIKFKI